MAEFTSHPHHPLYYWCLPQMALYIQSVNNLEPPPTNMTRMKGNLSLSQFAGMSILTMLEKIGLHLWEVMKKVINHCVNVAELLNSTTFLMCARDTMAMMDETKKSKVGLEAQERPRFEAKKMALQPVSLYNIIGMSAQMQIMENPMMKPEMFAGDEDEVVLADWLEWESDEEEEEGCNGDEDEEEGKEEQSSPDKEDETEWTDEEDSDWSDDDDEASEASTESTELWESFLNNDPYNPFYVSCTIGVKTKSADHAQLQNHTTSGPSKVKSTSGDVEERSPKEKTKEGTKKVRFSEDVKVHSLVAWSFASREARDGSCWMQLARDRERFKRRVERAGEVLSPCLTSQHRAKAWDRLQSSSKMLPCY